MNQDEQQLHLLAIFHHVMAVVGALFCSFPLIHVVMGLVLIFAPDIFDNKGDQPPPFIGWFFVTLGSLFVVSGWVFAALVFLAGRSLARKRHYTFCLVVAAVECCFQPFGTVLGVFTIVVLMRDSVKGLFGAGESPFAPSAIAGGRSG